MALPLRVVARIWGCYCMKRAMNAAWYTVSAQYMLPTDTIIIITTSTIIIIVIITFI